MALVKCEKCTLLYDFDDGYGAMRHSRECWHTLNADMSLQQQRAAKSDVEAEQQDREEGL